MIGRATIRPVERLTAAAEHVAATQDLDSTIDDRGEDELARLARSFNSMLRALAASRQQQAQLISDAGHELRTPLTSLRTNIEVLMRVKDLPDADRAELLSDVHAQLEEMTTLVGDVVELAREDEAQVAEPIEVRFDPIVERAVERARRRAPSVAFDVQLDAGLGPGPAGPAGAGGAQRARQRRQVEPARAGPSGCGCTGRRSWTLDVRDQGPGIAPADLPHVFDRFYRADIRPGACRAPVWAWPSCSRSSTAHGGTVTAASPPGGGTLIHIELPIVAENEPEAEQDRDAMRASEASVGPTNAWQASAGPGEALQPYLGGSDGPDHETRPGPPEPNLTPRYVPPGDTSDTGSEQDRARQPGAPPAQPIAPSGSSWGRRG